MSAPAEARADPAEPRRVTGLSRAEAAQRLTGTGPNEIARESQKPAWRLLLAQFNSPVIWLLLAACAVSAGLGEVADAVAIGAIVIINALVGFFQGRGGDPARMIRMLDILPADTPPTPGAVRSPSLDESLDAAREARIVRERSEEPEALAVEARVRDAIRLDAELRAGLHQPPVDYPVPTTRGLVIYCACMLAFIIFLSR